MTEALPLFPLGSVLFPGLVLPLHIFEERYRRLVAHLMDLPNGTARAFGVVALREGREVGADGVAGLDALHGVGCVAELRQVKAYDDGRFDLLAVGTRRFRLDAIDTGTPWITGAVSYLSEDGTAEPDATGARAADLGGPVGAQDEAPAPVDPAETAVVAGSVRDLFARYSRDLLRARGAMESLLIEADADDAEDLVGGDDEADEEDSEDELDDGSGGATDGTEPARLPQDPARLSYLVAAAAVLDLADKQRLLAAPGTDARLRAELVLLRREIAVLRRLPALPAVELARTPYGVN